MNPRLAADNVPGYNPSVTVRLAASTLLAAVLLLSACSSVMRARFPTEEEVRGRLRRGMTADEVLATFGDPPGHQWVDVRLGGKVHYIAPAAARTRPGEGYAGFTVYFDRGKVWDWEVILMNPSYEHRLLAGRNRWPVAAIGLLVVLAIGGLAFRRAHAKRSEREALLKAYSTGEIPEAELPPDFRFITHETTLQAVIEQAGPPSETKNIEAKSESGSPPLVAVAYELPSNGAVFVIPEDARDPNSRIRAVLFRRPGSASEL